jgi:hypothetical protein
MDEHVARTHCDDNAATMRWEFGRCEALEALAATQQARDAVWDACRFSD